MVKYVQFDSIDDYGVHLHSLEGDSYALTKLASNNYSKDLLDAIALLKREPIYYYIVINALGSLEAWGPNRNGDAYPRAGLSHYSLRSDMGTKNDYGYKTFEYYAHLYKHHCFTEDAMIKVPDGFKKISEIKIGDLVISATGERRIVKSKFERIYDGFFSKIDISGTQDFTCCTEDHLFETVKKQDILCDYHQKGVNLCTYLKHGKEYCEMCKKPAEEPTSEYIPASKIEPGDYLVKTIKRIKNIDDPKLISLGKLYGYFLSEGCFSKKNGKLNGLQFTFGKTEIDIHKDFISACSKLDLKACGPYFHKTNNTALFVISGKDIAESFYKKFGEYSYSKKLSLTITDELGLNGTMAMIGTYIDGDGNIKGKEAKRNNGLIRIRSSSIPLLTSFQSLLLSCGIVSSVNVDSPKERPFGKYIIKPNGILSITSTEMRRLQKFSFKAASIGGEFKSEKSSTRSFIYGDKMYAYVRSVESYKDQRIVYNLEVDIDNTYQVYGVNVHNCNKDPNKSFGKVFYSHWDPKMERVELIVGVDRINGKDIIEAVENNELVSTSMGCKVPFDQCSICDHKAKTVKEYCYHLQKYMGKIVTADLAQKWSKETGKTILPGTIVFAWNFEPRFFDISKVYVGADSVSYVLGKVASGTIISSAAIAEALGITDEEIDKLAIFGKDGAIKKDGEIDKKVGGPLSNDTEGKVIDKGQGAALKRIVDDNLQRTIVAEPSIGNGALDAMAPLDLREIFSTMFGLGIHPKPHEFQRIVIIKVCGKPMADYLDDNNFIFDKDAQVDPIDVDISSRYYNPSIERLLMPYLEKRSMFPDFLEKRMTFSMEKKAQVLGEEKERGLINPTNILLGLAALYAGLKLKAMGIGPKQMMETFVNAPWVPALLGGSIAYRLLFSRRNNPESVFMPISEYQQGFPDTHFSGHFKGASLGSNVALSAAAGISALPVGYVLNAYNQRSLYNTGSPLFPGAGISPPAFAELAGGGTLAALMAKEKYGKGLIEKIKALKR